MLELRSKPGETYGQTLARTLEEKTRGGELQDLGWHCARELRKLGTPPPGSLHPEACDAPLDERMSRLAESFPTLQGRPGVRPWSAPQLMDQELEPWTSNASREALRFVLGVWNQTNEVGERFNAQRAMGLWDDSHRRAFLAWVERPWWG